MNIANATLEQVLDFRERRSELQRELLSQYRLPLISFTMNIAGPVKRTALVEFAFDETIKRIRASFGKPSAYREVRCTAGCEAFFIYEREAGELKDNCVELEEEAALGRLLDLDVLRADGVKLSRTVSRKCLICGADAFPCARARRHSLAELTEKTNAILQEYAAKKVGEYAVQALLDEVRLTPKPGLVDAENSGAHSDMDISLMEKSANSLRGYFEIAAQLGMSHSTRCAQPLQRAGIEAERTMYAATNGVNTHKGLVFSLGLLCAAAGQVLADSAGSIPEQAARIAAGLREIPENSHGAAVKVRYSAPGARAEALSGFPHVLSALAQLKNGASKSAVLLSLMRDVEDSNLLWRGGLEGLQFVQSSAARILACPLSEQEREIRKLDAQCIARRLSPGGSADLLAAALFLNYLPFTQIDLA